MNISELDRLTYWIESEVGSSKIPQYYQNLVSVLQSQIRPNRPLQPFEQQKNDLIECLSSVPLHLLTKDQLRFLENIGIAKYIGDSGRLFVEDVLFRNAVDLATSAARLSEAMNSINQGISKSKSIRDGMDGCVEEEDYEVDNEVLIRISFTGKAGLKNVKDFKEWGRIWYDIGRGICIVNDAAPEDFKIIGATKGSIIIECAVAAAIATTTSSIILSALKVAEKVLNMRKAVEEIRNLKLQNLQLAIDLENEIDKEKQIEIEGIKVELLKALKLKKNSDGDKISELEKSIKLLVGFLESGGEVDFVLPEPDSTEDVIEGGRTRPDYGDLRLRFQEIKQIEGLLRRIDGQKI